MSVAINLRSLCRHVADERPRTVGEQQRAGFTLLREPQAPTARRAPMGVTLDAMVHDPTYQNLQLFTEWIVGRAEYRKSEGFWKRMAFNHPRRLHEELLELRARKLEGRQPDNPGGYLRSILVKIFPDAI